MIKKKLIIIVNDLNYFMSHRYEILKRILQENLYDVLLVYGSKSNDFNHNKELDGLGIRKKYLKFNRSSINPIKEIILIFKIYLLLRNEKPDILFLITMKPYLYGGIVARLTNIKNVISVVSGLGYLFSSYRIKNLFLKGCVSYLFKLAFRNKNQHIIFQNTVDKKIVLNLGVSSQVNTTVIKGAGVDLNKFNPLLPKNKIPTILFASRLIKEKGIYEFVKAAKYIFERNIKSKFVVLGDFDYSNPSCISKEEIDYWQAKNIIEFLGYRRDISLMLSKCHIFCLPSYYGEGMPKVLLEAAAAGRAVITSTNPGCREAILENKTGLLIPPKNHIKLANSIIYLLENMDICDSMGFEGRKLAEKEYSVNLVVDKHIEIFNKLN